MKKSLLENLDNKELARLTEENNSKIREIKNFLKKYDEKLNIFQKELNDFEKSKEELNSFGKGNIEICSEDRREASDFFTSREFFDVKFYKETDQDTYLELFDALISKANNLYNSNKYFHLRLNTRIDESVLVTHLKDHFPSPYSIKRYDNNYTNSEWLISGVIYKGPIFYNPVQQRIETELHFFWQKLEKITVRLNNFLILNIPIKRIYDIEIESVESFNRDIELILRRRKKAKEKDINIGTVYVLSNKSYPKDTYKIGSTYGLPEERAEQLSGTGHLTPFKVAAKIKIKSAEYNEKLLHKFLKDYRVRKDREYFTISLDKIKRCLNVLKNKSNNGEVKLLLKDLKSELSIKE